MNLNEFILYLHVTYKICNILFEEEKNLTEMHTNKIYSIKS